MAVRGAGHKHTRRGPAWCQRCGKTVPPVARKHRDPFCSRVCAEATYGTQPRSTPGRMVIGGLRIGGSPIRVA